jgi:hypothetical protein
MPGLTMTRRTGLDTQGSNGNRQAVVLPFPSSHQRRWALYACPTNPPRAPAVSAGVGRQPRVMVSGHA